MKKKLLLANAIVVLAGTAQAKDNDLLNVKPSFAHGTFHDQLKIVKAKDYCESEPTKFSECVKEQLKKDNIKIGDKKFLNRYTAQDILAISLQECGVKSDKKEFSISPKTKDCILDKGSSMQEDLHGEYSYNTPVEIDGLWSKDIKYPKMAVPYCLKAAKDYTSALEKWGKKNKKEVNSPFIFDGDHVKFSVKDKKDNKYSVVAMETEAPNLVKIETENFLDGALDRPNSHFGSSLHFLKNSKYSVTVDENGEEKFCLMNLDSLPNRCGNKSDFGGGIGSSTSLEYLLSGSTPQAIDHEVGEEGAAMSTGGLNGYRELDNYIVESRADDQFQWGEAGVSSSHSIYGDFAVSSIVQVSSHCDDLEDSAKRKLCKDSISKGFPYCKDSEKCFTLSATWSQACSQYLQDEDRKACEKRKETDSIGSITKPIKAKYSSEGKLVPINEEDRENIIAVAGEVYFIVPELGTGLVRANYQANGEIEPIETRFTSGNSAGLGKDQDLFISALEGIGKAQIEFKKEHHETLKFNQGNMTACLSYLKGEESGVDTDSLAANLGMKDEYKREVASKAKSVIDQ